MPPYTTDSTDPGGRRQVILAIVFLVVAVVALLLPDRYQTAVASTLREIPLGPFVMLQETLVQTRERAGSAERLQAQLDSLSVALLTRATLAEENQRLRELLSLSEETGSHFRPATLIRPGTKGSGSTFLVDLGSEDGVRENSPVIAQRGLLGMILDVRPRSAAGIDWTHPDFRASAMTGDGRIFGLVEVRRGDFREEDRLVFNGAGFQTRLEDGTMVVTSGLGGVFPRGIPLGRVDGLAEAEAGWRKSYWLRPAIEPGAATHVLVGVEGEEEAIPADLARLWPPDTVRSRFGQRVQDLQVPAVADSLLTPPEALGDAFHTRGSEMMAALREAGRPARSETAPGPSAPADEAEEGRVEPPITQPIEPRPPEPEPDTGPPPDTTAGGGSPDTVGAGDAIPDPGAHSLDAGPRARGDAAPRDRSSAGGRGTSAGSAGWDQQEKRER